MSGILYFLKKIRIGNPWNFKMPTLIALPYWVLLSNGTTASVGLPYIGWSFLTIIGIAGFGYVVNDLADKKQDLIAKKSNAFGSLPRYQMILTLIVFLLCALIPWAYFPMDNLSYALLIAEFLLFLLYSIPPIRFKERKTGVLIDSLYAHVLPAVLAVHTFTLINETWVGGQVNFLIVLLTWQLVLGVRNILFHQLGDFENDMIGGTRTTVTQIGSEKVENWMPNILILESVLFAGLWLLMSFFSGNWWFLLLLFVHITAVLSQKSKPSGYRQKAYKILDDFYLDWMPVILLVGLVFQDIGYLLLAFFHLLAIRNIVKARAISTFNYLFS